MNEVAQRRVEVGAWALDTAIPGWASKIDLPKLDMGSASFCILGQLYEGRYTAGGTELMQRVDPDIAVTFQAACAEDDAWNRFQEWAIEHGFEEAGADEEWYGYGTLHEHWLLEIGRRQQAA